MSDAFKSDGASLPERQDDNRQLKADLAQSLVKITTLEDSLRRADARRHLAEQRLIKTRASRTYQLGYQLKTCARSPAGLLRLPGILLKLYLQGCKHRKVQVPDSHAVSATFKHAPGAASAAITPAPAPVKACDYVGSHVRNDALVNARPLRMACVMDPFTYESYRYECELLQLTPAQGLAELQRFQPELLFIESAWRGKDDLWNNKIGQNSEALRGVLKWCKDHNVPTVFWNKEDPVHFETFLSTAKQFDFVFTTDIDCVHRYKAALGHERVYLLPFACQPAIHNPIEWYERKDAFCFAGAYYVRYPERTRDLVNFVSELPRFRPVEIFDRNLGKQDANYQFPVEFEPCIVGTLNASQMGLAYKGYRYAINLNSIKQSQSMFARRVFELLGSNTLTVSNFSRGLRLLFGDLVIASDSTPEILRRLDVLADNPDDSEKIRLAALRKVMQEHTYAHRLNHVLTQVTGHTPDDLLPTICILASAANLAELQALTRHLHRQRYQHLVMHVVVNDDAATTDSRLRLIRRQQLNTITLGELAKGATWFGTLLAEDYYGPHYLLDLALATRYSQADVIGKVTHYAASEQGVHLQNPGQGYRCGNPIAARCALIKTSLLADSSASDWLKTVPSLEYQHPHSLAIDAFNYCKNAVRAGEQHVRATVDDLELFAGISLDQLQRHAEAIPPMDVNTRGAQISGKRLAGLLGPMRGQSLQDRIDGDTWDISSSLVDGKHEYHYASQELSVAQLAGSESLKLFLDATPGLNIQLVILFLDAQKQRISHVMHPANCNQTSDVPPETAYLRLGVRVQAGGTTRIKALVLGHRNLQPSTLIAKADHLLLTNHYPAYDDLYRNGFVHSRVRAYQKGGIQVDVFRLRQSESVSYHEFENVDVITGSAATLATMLESGSYKTVLVHFLDPQMWAVLHQYMHIVRIIVWVHGAEIQPWWRRAYNYTHEEQRQLAKLDSEKRMSFWRGLLDPMPSNLTLIFVSRHFAEEVMEDLGLRLPDDQYQIIHNPIDTGLFSHEQKPVEQRKKILSVRPYASAKYANDLSVRAIELLARKPYFAQLQFHMVGDGALFEETLAPLRKYPNVKIEQRFLRQQEIAMLHKHYGLFLCPSRMDAQGVSRDEAMASGLVPVTNNVSAIPEFVDDACAVLAPAEDAKALAAGIARIVEDPQLFLALSTAARARIERQTSMSMIIEQEMRLIGR